MQIKNIKDVIEETNIIIMSPHFDDALLMMGGYFLQMKKVGLLQNKKFDIKLLFSRSNYQVRSGELNFDTSVGRIKMATGNRLIEDQNCLDEVLGRYKYRYELMGEDECFARGKSFTDDKMEFPHGMFKDFDQKDNDIFERMKDRIRNYAMHEDTALIFPMAIKEHIDHFITREASIIVTKELKNEMKANFYYVEDKPYAGLATDIELERMERFIINNKLKSRLFEYEPEEMINLAFRHYISQVEEVYSEGIEARADFWRKKMNSNQGLDRICLLKH